MNLTLLLEEGKQALTINCKQEAAATRVRRRRSPFRQDPAPADDSMHIYTNARYLIVIDDVWTIRAWDAIQSKLPENNCSSRVIVTTRIETVAKSCSPASVNGHYIHHMESLKLEDSKKLFLSRVFGSESASYPKELAGVMSNILKKCSGLPLAIISIASVLAGYTLPESKEKWETICRSIGSQMERYPTLEGMKQIVTLSYNHLPHELKVCMMYLSTFPEDYEINKNRLLCRWVAEGMVLEKRGLTLMEVAESYFEELLSRNMIELRVRFIDYRMVELCRVHDMLLEVMVSKSLECNFVSILGGQYAEMSYDRIRRLSIQGDDKRNPQSVEQSKKKMSSRSMEGMDVKHVRSLSMFQSQVHKVLNHIKKFTLLRVLDLEDCESLTNDHMRYICRLYLLRFLSVKGTNITKVPPQVGKLEHLQTLDTRSTCLRGLPETMTNLEKLERVEFRHKHQWNMMWSLPRGLKKMKALREVDLAFLKDDLQVARELGELQQLQSILMYIQCEDNDGEVLRQLAHSLGKIYSLRRLGIAHIRCGIGKITFLHNLPTPPRLLRYLRIEGILDRLPLWLESLSYRVDVEIMHTELAGDQVYGVLCKFPNLKSIMMLRKFYRDEEMVARTSHNFHALTNLMMLTDSKMPQVLRFEQGSIEKLEKLHVRFTNKDRTILGIEYLTNLKEVQLTGNKQDSTLYRAMDQFKAENRRRLDSSQSPFQVVVKYE
ncbi:hypothetical protein PR202_ga28172 [Eleusine coracana subsp. coracana]|uniref:NB-ARC domain-containing protein n=1 Tax=Eleusine coracana subsp. coracana TaxID=191504 RepID=A0AAV5DGQ2_ELECO|nr:hypothetical protein PR202_ga28172 [Eleusine coracana subsp. coracana]